MFPVPAGFSGSKGSTFTSAISVDCMTATSVFSPLLYAQTSPEQTASVRPALITFPIATNRSPFAGARKLILFSTPSTSESAGIRV